MQRAEDTDNLNVQLLIALCCLVGGLRRSELGGLKWEDINLNEKEAYIHIQRAVVQGQDGLVEKETKTKAGKRIIPIKVGGTVYKVLQKARKEQMKLRSSEADFQGDNHVFILYQYPYRPMTPERIYKTFKRFMQKECPELPCYRLHDLRHLYVKPTTKNYFLSSNSCNSSMLSRKWHSTGERISSCFFRYLSYSPCAFSRACL